jgi:hypothetical protein
MLLWQRHTQVELQRYAQQPGHWLMPLRIACGHILRLPKLRQIVLLAMGVNLVIGVTFATSAAMVTSLHGASQSFYALLQTAGALATIAILYLIARVTLPLVALAATSYLLITAGGILSALGPTMPTPPASCW